MLFYIIFEFSFFIRFFLLEAEPEEDRRGRGDFENACKASVYMEGSITIDHWFYLSHLIVFRLCYFQNAKITTLLYCISVRFIIWEGGGNFKRIYFY